MSLRPLDLALALAATLVIAGCGGSGDGQKTDAGQKPDAEQKTHDIAVAAKPPANPQKLSAEAAGTDFDYKAYDKSVEQMLALVDDFWERTAEGEGEDTYGPPHDVIAYDPADKSAPKCGGQPPAPQNAFYCPPDDIVAWDEPGLFVPYYEKRGDLAVGIILAHEWGHLVQRRLGLDGEYAHTIESELAADCFAGAWLGDLEDQDLLDGKAPGEGGDIDTAADTVFSIGDPPQVPFQDPDAHGTGDERVDALGTGYEGGLESCEEDYAPGFTDESGSKVKPSDAKSPDLVGAG